jgi:hypothetical protein
MFYSKHWPRKYLPRANPSHRSKSKATLNPQQTHDPGTLHVTNRWMPPGQYRMRVKKPAQQVRRTTEAQ